MNHQAESVTKSLVLDLRHKLEDDIAIQPKCYGALPAGVQGSFGIKHQKGELSGRTSAQHAKQRLRWNGDHPIFQGEELGGKTSV
jgi:hypothetical protein